MTRRYGFLALALSCLVLSAVPAAAFQYGTAVRNAKLDAIETTVGTTPHLKIYTGSAPANCAGAETGTLLVDMTLPADWMNDASAGSKTLKGTWSGTAAATGTAAHFRITDSAGTTCEIQGTVGMGAGDLQLDNTSIASGQTVQENTFTITDNNG